MKNPVQAPGALYRMMQQYKEAQLLLAGIQLDVFSHLQEAVTAAAVAGETRYDARNLALFLNSLAAIGLLEKKR
ncbi:methyltransferase family protein [Propionispora hippei]|uniref:Dimerisation domain-containing protein n=1 Tax=Propionispora hippei DSM 15287 TaxID=1123003 RepID=A0A1M6DR85_9FIRM|nr:methyltransferase dimerization domain-containing protein [Propionispora hippei]SHI75650.1 Dimerisation domain-containing protein [Propionispora hippei DSM 15287]